MTDVARCAGIKNGGGFAPPRSPRHRTPRASSAWAMGESTGAWRRPAELGWLAGLESRRCGVRRLASGFVRSPRASDGTRAWRSYPSLAPCEKGSRAAALSKASIFAGLRTRLNVENSCGRRLGRREGSADGRRGRPGLDAGSGGVVRSTQETEWGTKYVVTGSITAPDGAPMELATVWIVRGDAHPLLVTAYPWKVRD